MIDILLLVVLTILVVVVIGIIDDDETSSSLLLIIKLIDKYQSNVDQTPDNQDPVWKLSDLEKLRRIYEQLKLLFQIRDNCVKIIQDFEQLQNKIQRPTSPRIRPCVYQQTSNRPLLNLSLPQYTTPLTIKRIDPHSSDEETTYTYQPIAGSSGSNSNQNLIDFSDQIIVNYSQHNSQEEQQEGQEEEQDNQNNNPLLQYYNPNINNNTQEPEEDNPASGSSSEHSSNNSDTQKESEEEMVFVVKPPKFSGVHNEDRKEWLEDFLDELRGLKQRKEESVEEYYYQVKKMARRVGINANATLPHFVRGLLPDIKAIVKTHAPANLATALTKVKLFEQGKGTSKRYKKTKKYESSSEDSGNESSEDEKPRFKKKEQKKKKPLVMKKWMN
ncbi:hypothetical protein Glove_221g26 [Diversispora epigaea]|uniref:Retrotransposon gag domain-containing protein n=1 Tax=Diversispora epigaea TaxID=1348612 RepID=A0A397IF81_9GLOM|nr:hypothetical protein Glove_221g26 [Diversispora epigaea]